MGSYGIPSLKQLSLTKVIDVILNKNHIFESLVLPLSFSLRFNVKIAEKRRRAENTVLEKVSQLVLPKLLKEELASFVRPFLVQVGALMHYHDLCFDCHMKRPNIICWTTEGTIDRRKTAELLVRDKDLPIATRFIFACLYCLEDHIYSLWSKLPKEVKEIYKILCTNARGPHMFLMPSFWVNFLENTLEYIVNDIRFNLPFEFGFQISVDTGNEVACRYFLEKLTLEEKENKLVIAAKRVAAQRERFNNNPTKIYYTDVLFILLSVMNDEQRVQLFSTKACVILKCFFDWPWRNLSTQISYSFWAFLRPFNYCYMFSKFKKRFSKARKDCDYEMMFMIFWQQIPDDQKKLVIKYSISESSLINLFEVLEKKSIRLILNDVIDTLGMEIIYECKGKKIYDSLMHYNKWDSFEFFLEKCALSKQMLINLKEGKGHICRKEQEIQKDMLVKSYEIIDKLIQQCDKRKIMEEDDHSAKRLCNMKLETNLKVLPVSY